MEKKIAVVALLAVLVAASTFAQTTDFFELVKTGTPQEVRAAISKGADINALNDSKTPLMFAANVNPDPEVITVLLKAGANLEARSFYYGWTALICAAETNANPEVINALVKAGANIEAQDRDGRTALTIAAQYNQPEVINALVKAGANIEAQDKDGQTPLMFAAQNPNPEVISALLKAGADRKAEDNSGFTALMLAASKNTNPVVIMMLLRAGADAKVKNNKGYTAFDYAKFNRSLEGTDALKQLEEASK